MRRSSRAGNTLIEVTIAGTLLALLLGSLGMLVGSTSESYKSVSESSAVETEAMRLMDRIVEKLRNASAPTIWPTPSGFLASNQINFRSFEDAGGGNVSLTNLQRIRFNPFTQQVVWTEDVGGANERSVTWSNSVPILSAGEQFNLVDDNGNGLIDELGLSFTTQGDLVLIRLTVETATRGGQMIQRTFEGRVFCRT